MEFPCTIDKKKTKEGLNMKKKGIVIILVLCVIIGVMGGMVYQHSRYQYEVAEAGLPQYFVVQQNEKYGVMNGEGTILVQPNYVEVQIPNPEKPVFVCYRQEGEKAEILNERSETLYTNYEAVSAIVREGVSEQQSYETTRLLYSKDGKYGLLSLEGEMITKPIYEEIKSIGTKEGIFQVKQEEHYGVINGKGTTIVKPKYASVRYDDGIKPGYIVSEKTEQGYRYGYVNEKGKKVLEAKYNNLERIMGEQNKKKYYFIAFLDGQAGVLENKKEILPHQYTDIVYHEQDHIFIGKRNERLGAFDEKGKEILPAEYQNLYIAGDYMNAEKDGNVEVYEKSGKKVENALYKSKKATDNEEYSIVIDKEDKYGVIGKNGNIYIDCSYEYIEYITKDYFLATRDGKTGVITKDNKSVVELKYSALTKIEGTKLLQATLKEEARTTTEILDYTMKKVASLENGIVEVKEGYIKLYSMENTFYVNNEGVSKAAKEVLGELSMYASRDNGKWGFIGNDGTVKVDYQYDRVTQLNAYGFAGIYLNGKWGVINKEGTVIVEPTYEIPDTIEPDFIGTYYQKSAVVGNVYYTN